jgi:hypothetical protein
VHILESSFILKELSAIWEIFNEALLGPFKPMAIQVVLHLGFSKWPGQQQIAVRLLVVVTLWDRTRSSVTICWQFGLLFFPNIPAINPGGCIFGARISGDFFGSCPNNSLNFDNVKNLTGPKEQTYFRAFQ